MHILVTGANGLIGHHLCRHLLERDVHVWALTRSPRPALLQPLRDHQQLKIIRGDINDRSFTNALFGDQHFDAVCHLAVERFFAGDTTAAAALRDTNAYRTNFEGSLNLMQAAANAGVGAWVHSSAMLVYDIEHTHAVPVNESLPPAPAEHNGMSVYLGEEACRYYGRQKAFRQVILRYPGVYGLGKERGAIAKFVRHCLSGTRSPLTAPANRSADFLSVEDAVQANLLAIDRLTSRTADPIDGEIFHIGSGQETTIADAAKMIRRLTGARIDIIETESGHPRRFYFDNTRARARLDFRPRSLEQGLTDYIAALQRPGTTATSPLERKTP